MRKFLVFLLAGTFGLVLASTTRLIFAQQEQPQCTLANGDVDGNGRVQLTDAVSILNHLFRGQPTNLLPLCSDDKRVATLEARLVELENDLRATQQQLDACRAGNCPGLPATGVTECADENGALLSPCPDGEARRYAGQDGFYQSGCPMEGRFVVNDNGTPQDSTDDTVTDTCTGLEWQRNRAQPSQTYDPEGDAYVTWEQALSYCSAIGDDPNADLAFKPTPGQPNFHTDWRLPNVRELQSIIHYGTRRPALDAVFTIQTSSNYRVEYYWSSSSFTGVLDSTSRPYAFRVNIEYGEVSSDLKRAGWYTLAVRNAQ